MMIPAIFCGENQPKTLIGSHPLSETHPPLVLTLEHASLKLHILQLMKSLPHLKIIMTPQERS
jgi:hypothetical protein